MSAMIKELIVMNDMAEKLDALSHEERRRVVLWLLDYFAIYEDDFIDVCEDLTNAALADEDADDVEDLEEDEVEVDDVEEELEAEEEVEPLTFAALFEQVAPKTAIQKIVTAAWWLEVQEGQTSWKAFEANKLLKSLGVKISSVSGTLATESKKDIPFIEVLAKSGDAMQARKTFRLSEAGLAFVEDRID